MANTKISQLTELTDPEGADILAIVDDVASTPTTKKVTATNLMTLAPVQSVAGRTGAVTLSNTDIAGLGTAATTASTDYATAAQGTTADSSVQPTDSIDVLADVDTSTVAPVANDLLKWNGSSFVPGQVDVDGPLTTALRGVENPHIGANPNQSFKVMDNPSQSAMVVADSDGNITYLLKEANAEVKVAKANGSAVRFALASDLPAFVLENDSGEPDIEVTDSATGEKISVISGDSDTKGANGLPIRQGYNLPDIGAYPSPLLISGGSIA